MDVRNYGFLVNNIGSIGTKTAPVMDPFAAGIIQVAPLDLALAPFTDVYFRGYDQNYPDLWRYNEWKRVRSVVENRTAQPVTGTDQPRLYGSFGSALGGVNTPETQQADCDLALDGWSRRSRTAAACGGHAVHHRRRRQDGPDHVDLHRGTAFVVGPYVRQGAVISTRYSQINALRTIEDILDTEHINLNTAFQRPMTDVFDIHHSGKWNFTAEASTVLATTTVASLTGDNGVRFAAGPMLQPRHDAAYWDKVTAGFDFSEADHVPPARFNRVLWTGLMGSKPYPAVHAQTFSSTRNDH